MRPLRSTPPELSEELLRKLHIRGRWWPIVGLVCTVLFGALDGFNNLRELWQSFRSESQSDEPLYDVPVIKGPRSTLDSLELKHQDSLQDLEDVLRLRGSNSKDLKTALSLLNRVVENESRTAEDELFSHLYSLQGDLLTREGKPAEASPILEKACKLNPRSWEMPFLLLGAYKAERYELELSLTPEDQENRIPRIQYLAKKIKELEEDLYPNLQSLLHLFGGSSDIELAAGAHFRSAGEDAPVMAVCNSDFGLKFCLEDSPTIARTAGGIGIGCAFGYDCNFDVTPADKQFAAGGAICDTGPHDCKVSWHLDADHVGYTNALTRWWTHVHGLPRPTPTGTGITADTGLIVAGFVRNQVLAVGINGGPGADFDGVTYAATDAQRVSAALRGRGFSSMAIVNHDATKSKILAELARVTAASQPDDMFVFYFSGHGFTDNNGHPVLVTGGKPTANGGPARAALANRNDMVTDGGMTRGNGNLADDPIEVLFLEEVVDVLSHHRGRAVVILDNCLNGMPLNTGVPRRTAAGPNRPTIILAGEPGGQVIESPRLGSGLFTYTLLRFLEQQRTSSELDLDAMFRYTASETARLARDLYGMSQRPQWLPVR